MTDDAQPATPAAQLVATCAALLDWTHTRNESVLSLVRFRQFGTEVRGAHSHVVITELPAPRGCGVLSDFARLAATAAERVIPRSVDVSDVCWYAHHGEFSRNTYESIGTPESLTQVHLTWDGPRPALLGRDAIHLVGQHDDARRLAALLHLENAEDILAELMPS